MNKRQRKKRMKKIFERMADPLPDEVFNAVSDFIRSQLARPSISYTFVLSPDLKPPFEHVADATGLVHLTGMNTRTHEDSAWGMDVPATDRTVTVRLRVCDFEQATESVTGGAVTCVRCVTYQHERTQEKP